MDNQDYFRQSLQKLEDDFNQQYQKIRATNLTVPVVDGAGNIVYMKHYEKQGRKWVEKTSPAMQVNPEIGRLRRRLYDEKAALFRAHKLAEVN